MEQIIQTSARVGHSAPSYRSDLISAAMGEKRLTNVQVAVMAKVTVKVVSAIRNGAPNVMLPSLISVATALEIDMQKLFEPKQTNGVSSVGA